MKHNALKKQIELCESKESDKRTREIPVLVTDIGHNHPLHILANKLLLWAPRDLRYNRHHNQDSDLLNDVAAGMETRISNKDLINNLLDLTVEVQENIDEYERYNIVAREHNRQWIDNGAHKDTFNPLTGEVTELKDTYLDPAMPSSSHNPLAEELFDSKSHGPLASARPSMKRKGYIRVRYHLQIQGDLFILGYAAYDKLGRVIYYNEVRDRDLSKIARRSTQELWGNPMIPDRKPGPYLEGIPMLINGKKLIYCRNNQRPVFLDNETIFKTSNPELTRAELTQTGMRVSSTLLGYWIPIALVGAMLVWSGQWLIAGMNGHSNSGLIWMTGMAVILFTLVAVRHLSRETSRKASAIDAQKRFI